MVHHDSEWMCDFIPDANAPRWSRWNDMQLQKKEATVFGFGICFLLRKKNQYDKMHDNSVSLTVKKTDDRDDQFFVLYGFPKVGSMEWDFLEK